MSGKFIQLVLRSAVVPVIATLAACSTTPPPPPAEPPPPEIAPTPAPAATVEPAPEGVTPTLVEPAAEETEIAIVLSDRQPAYELVATELAGQLDRYTIFDLSDKSQVPVTAFRRIADSEASAVVAVGMRAAISATSMSKVPVIFCQVFNYQDNDLVTENSRGVSSLPPLDLQIAAWKQIDPKLKRIGAIVGEGHEQLIEEAQMAAAAHGIELHLRTVKSDRETQYVFNRLVGDIDGFWLFPDNRVLSAKVLQHIVSYSARRRVQVAVFNESLLQLGATLSSSAVESDIAATIARLIGRIEDGDLAQIEPMTSLSDVRIVTNDDVLRQIMVAREEARNEATAQVRN